MVVIDTLPAFRIFGEYMEGEAVFKKGGKGGWKMMETYVIPQQFVPSSIVL